MTTPTDHMTIAEIIHDYATRQGDLTDRWAREDLAAILERRMVVRSDELDAAMQRNVVYLRRAYTAELDANKCREVAAALTIELATLRAGLEELAKEWEVDDQTSLDTFGQHQYATTGQLAGMLRYVLADNARAVETEGAS